MFVKKKWKIFIDFLLKKEKQFFPNRDKVSYNHNVKLLYETYTIKLIHSLNIIIFRYLVLPGNIS